VKAREDGSPFVYIGLLAVKKGHQVRHNNKEQLVENATHDDSANWRK